MPIPLLIGAAAVALAGVGIKKGVDAKKSNNRAKEVVDSATERFDLAKYNLEKKREELNYSLEKLGELKVDIFTNHIKRVVELTKLCKDSGSKLNVWSVNDASEIAELEKMVENSLEISSGLLAGATSGALTAMGAYGSVGLFAAASTGTAISSLSGVAATNATLAWLGGGSLAAGGFGMAGGMAALGGILAGPAIAIVGYTLDSKAQENMTKAVEFSENTDIKIEKMDASRIEYQTMQDHAQELKTILLRLSERLDDKIVNLAKIMEGDSRKYEKDLMHYNKDLERYQLQIIEYQQLYGNIFRKFISFIAGKKPQYVTDNIRPIEPKTPVKLLPDAYPEFADIIIMTKGLKQALDIGVIATDGHSNLSFNTQLAGVIEI